MVRTCTEFGGPRLTQPAAYCKTWELLFQRHVQPGEFDKNHKSTNSVLKIRLIGQLILFVGSPLNITLSALIIRLGD